VMLVNQSKTVRDNPRLREKGSMSMWVSNLRWRSLVVCFVAFVVGCAARPTESPSANEEGAVREKFAELQTAIKDGQTEKLWALLANKSQSDAERAAKDLQNAHAKASAEEKSKQEELLGMSAKDLAGLTGIGILKTKRFQKKYRELPESKIEKVSVQGDNATVHFLEPDDDHEKLIFVRQDGQWKAWLAMPNVLPKSKT
jgi:hypothetical protein